MVTFHAQLRLKGRTFTIDRAIVMRHVGFDIYIFGNRI